MTSLKTDPTDLGKQPRNESEVHAPKIEGWKCAETFSEVLERKKTEKKNEACFLSWFHCNFDVNI